MTTIGTFEIDDIYCGKSEELLAKLPDACIDLTVTSPPYDNLRAYNGFFWDFTLIATQLYRVTKPGGVVVWVVGDATVNGSETGSSFRQALGFMEIGFNLHDTMIYEKDSLQFPDTTRCYQVFEYMFVLSKGLPDTTNIPRINTTHFDNSASTKRQPDGTLKKVEYKTGNETRAMGNVWKFGVGNGKTTLDKYAFQHSAMFPEGLAKRHIETWSNPGDVVLDPFAGSGTTAKMSKVLSRHWLGFDISQEYVDLARRRVAAANVPLPLFVEQPAKPRQDVLL